MILSHEFKEGQILTNLFLDLSLGIPHGTLNYTRILSLQSHDCMFRPTGDPVKLGINHDSVTAPSTSSNRLRELNNLR